MNGALLARRNAELFWQTGTAITVNAVAMFSSQSFARITKRGGAEPRHFITVRQGRVQEAQPSAAANLSQNGIG